MKSLDSLPVSILELIFNHLDGSDLQTLAETSDKFKLVIENTPKLLMMAQEDDRSPLESMPVEIRERIFSNLASHDLCSLAATCRTFSSIITGSEKLSKKLTLFMRYPKDVKAFVRDISTSDRRFKTLHIKRTNEAARLSDEIDAATSSRFYEFMSTNLGPRIENLSITWKNPSCIRDINYTVELQRILHPLQRRMFSANDRVPLHVILHNLENDLPNQGFFGERNIRNHRAAAAANRAVSREEDAVAAQQIRTQINQIRDDIVGEFLDLIRCFTNVKTLQLTNVNLERTRAGDLTVSLPNLTRLSLHECDHHCYTMLEDATSLRALTVFDNMSLSRENSNTRMQKFENFLLSQQNLVELKMSNFFLPRFLLRDRTDEIKFNLTSLSFKNVHFANKNVIASFLEKQSALKSIDFQIFNERSQSLDSQLFFNGFLATITNPRKMQLNTIVIDKIDYRLNDCDFLKSNFNPHVKHLVFQVSSDDRSSKLFKVLIRILPNLETIEFKTVDHEESESMCFDDGTHLAHCTSLHIINSSVRSLSNITAPNLVHFQFVPERSGGYIDDIFGGFFIRHRNIKTLVIGNCIQRSYFFVSYILCKTIVDFLSGIEHITIYNFAEVNKSVKLLSTLPKLRSLTLSAEDHQQFTAKTKVECARNNLKLISVNIGNGTAPAAATRGSNNYDPARLDVLALH